jgi:Na+-translocating ferredoxin:NAD+ oxidoreductase subunit E
MNYVKNSYRSMQKDGLSSLLVLGVCPALTVTTSLTGAIAMGLATTFVLAFSSLIISLFRKMISSNIRFAASIIVIATFTTIADLLLQAYFPEQSKALGIYVALIVINGIALNRAEGYALNNKIISSFIDGLVVGIIFTVVIMLTGSLREVLGSGSILDYKIVSENVRTILFFILPPGAFITFGFLIALVQKLNKKTE